MLRKLINFLRNINRLASNRDELFNHLNTIERTCEENNWANIFNSTISSTNWLKNKSFSPGRWAAGYPFLYILYRVLDEAKPESILELGLGQTTKMITQYVQYYNIKNHFLVEHDTSWINICKQTMDLSNTKIINLALDTKLVDNNPVTIYRDFDKAFDNMRFSLLSIDAPFGSEYISRIDTLSIIPQCLDDNFVILIDDCERTGEQQLVKEIKKRLTENNIKFCYGSYEGLKKTDIIVSDNLKFFTSI
ncbi:MAG: hypothetical protein SPH50_01320 [Methanobrevibacter smithii]|nr:hypothetical protein [Methanobrevibacter smithii]MDD7698431.1 hypothetical protein [Spirochaetia bacterium]MDY5217604.1 hypothetical protein [Methanobrevibacter smithii]